jgi:hypothetical protein
MPLSYSSGAATFQAFGYLKPQIEDVIIRQNLPASSLTEQSITIKASGAGTLTYQWYFNGNLIQGETTNTLPSSSISQAGTYTCVVSNSYGTVYSQECVVYSNSDYTGLAPVIITQPADTYVLVDETAQFSVFAIGAVTLNYQWYENGLPVAGSNSSTLYISNTSAQPFLKDGYTYYCKIWNSLGEVYSQSATLKFKPVAPVSSTPPDQIVFEGNVLSLSLSFNATAYPTPTVHWYLPNGQTTLSGANVTIPSVLVDENHFSLGKNYINWKVFNIAGFDSGRLELFVLSQNQFDNFSIVSQPENVTLTTAPYAQFSVEVDPPGNTLYTYKWFVDNVEAQGFDYNNTYNYYPTCTETSNTHSVRVQVKSGDRTILSENAYVYLSIPPEITLQPTDQTGNVGDVVVFSLNVCSPSLYLYRWYKNGQPISGAVNKTLAVSITNQNMHGDIFYCEVSLPDGSATATSDNATLLIDQY